MNEPRLNFWPPASNGSSAASNCAFQTISQRDQLVVGVVVDDKHGAGACNAAARPDVAFEDLHRSVEDLIVGNADRSDIIQLAKGPGGVVVDIALRVVRCPILQIEHHVGDPAIRLVHADDIAAGGKFTGGWACRLLFCPSYRTS